MNEQNGPAPSIAIVGMAGRFPGAADLEAFWANLASGIESVRFFRREELAAAGIDPAQLDDPAYVPARAVLDGAELFDAGVFGFTPREAELMDPQHRLLLECAWEALENAGCDPRRFDGLVGVYAGAGTNAYLLSNLIAHREALASAGQFQTMVANGGDFLATRLSYKLGLRGPSLTVQTACSTSLVAVHLAVQSLLNGECDLALAGGVRVSMPRAAGYLYQTGGVLSPDGHCRPFDAEGRGTVDGEGAGLVVLKRLEDALAGGDRIHAVILGTAVNNDGDDRVGFTAPGVSGQAGVLAMAQAVSGVHPETVGLIEGHGTATPLGDPIEVAALRQVFEASTARKGFCALGSVKANIGHLDAAAGVASLIKAALALERGLIPPTPHFQRQNPQLGLAESPFYINAQPVAWPAGLEPRRAGVSSFGMGGTNAHVVLEEAPPVPPGDSSGPWQILVLSAASVPALEAMTDRLAGHLARHPELDLADVAFTLQTGRRELKHRRVLICRSLAEAREALSSRREIPSDQAPEPLRSLAEHWLAGAEVDWRALHAGQRRLRVPLPAYPFQRQRYWIGGEAPAPAEAKPAPARAPRRPRSTLGARYVPPSSDLEKRIAALFEDLLGVEPIGSADNFFEMGGHSLLGLQLLSRVKSELGAEVRLEWLFQAASVGDLAGLIGLLEEAAGTGKDVIPRAPRDADLPLSFAQERLWFLDRLDPGTPAFNLTESVRLTGGLDVPALGRALSEVVRRHESLRTAFVDVQGRPVQRILPAVDIPLPLVDLSGLPEEAGETEAGRLTVRSGERSFDLSRPPLLTAEAYRLRMDRHSVVLVFHHIVGDGWSSSVLLSDLAQIYRAFVAGETPVLPELPIQYADFAAWQRARLGEEGMAAQVAAWRERLAPPLPVLDFPTDRPRPAVQTFRGASEVLVLPPELANGLRGLGANQGATPFMVLLAGFALVLSRWSGQQDMIIGSPIAGRDRGELEGLIGIFLNMLPLRLDLTGDPSFRVLLGRVRETALAAYAGQEVPVERLIGEGQLGRDLSRSPLFQVLFNFLAFPHPVFDVPGLAIEANPPDELPARFDFTVYAEEIRNGGMALDLTWNADLFDGPTMAGFLGQLRRALEGAVAWPDVPLSQIPLVTPEAAAVLPDPRASLADGVPGQAVHERFAEWARRHPERLAVVDAQRTWTYGELAERVDGLARLLRETGVEPGHVVAIFTERGAPLVQAILAVLAVDAAFLILDPAHPEARRRSIARQARPRVWIEAAENSDELACRCGDAERSLRQPGLAYLAFTSGSTGEPKGILGAHGPLAHFCAWHAATFGLGPDDRFSMLSGLSHDPLLRDVFTPLSLGATLCIPAPDDLLSPARLAGWMARQGITVCHLTPGLGQLLADGGTPLPDLRYAFFGGDALTEEDVDRLRALVPLPRKLTCVNFYGATETPQAIAWYDASGAGAWPARRVPVGRGIDGVQLLVLNEAGQLAAPGELGEIVVRTPHLSLGYLGDEGLTAERYRANPFTGDPADRVYRTGDLGRFRHDGAVSLAGRRDGQAQVRGFRVEPAEVEAALGRHSAVRDAAVMLRAGRLTAWLVLAPGSLRPRSGELRDFLRGLLPDPMIPEAFVWLERLPLTANGKLDRQALPDPVREEPEAGFEPPATPLEERVAAIWRELLGLERVGRHESFFELGGHSLLATRIVARVQEAFGVELPVRRLFESPTVSGLAACLPGAAPQVSTPSPEVPVETGRRAPLSFGQQRLWFLDRLEPGSPAYNLPFAARLRGPLDTAALAAAFSGIVRRHEVLRTVFEEGPVQVVAPAAPMPLPMVDLAGLPADARRRESGRLMDEEARRPFDLARGPVLRAGLLRLGEREHALLVTLHHIAGDGWSVGILTRELNALYASASMGLPWPLPRLPMQYADFAIAQRERLQGEALEELLAWWRRELGGAPTILDLPADRSRSAVADPRAGRCRFVLPASLAGALRALSAREGGTLFMTILAAFQALLHRLTGREDLLVGTPIANRGRVEIEALIGFFVNTLALRGRLSPEIPFLDLLARTRETALGAYAHQELPFERLVDELEVERAPVRNPLVQVVLSLQNLPLGDLRLAGLEATLEEAIPRAALFDFSVTLIETGGALAGWIDYAEDLFDRPTAARFAGCFETLLEAAVAGPGRRLADLPLLGEGERHQLAREAAAREDYKTDLSLWDLFVAQAERRPQAVAVSFEEGSLTYGALARRAAVLARRLQAHGVGPETPVALWFEREPGLVVAILGVLAAGGTYVPLDPAWPAERVALVLEDSGARLLLRGPGTPLPGVSPEILMDLEDGGAGDGPLAPGAGPDNAAYAIYTSGSTGRPKGVEVTHRNVARLLAATRSWFGFGEQDVWTLFHSYAFDFSVWEIWGALAHGGRLAIVPWEASRSPEAFADLLDREGVTVLNQTPSAFYGLAGLERRVGASLRWVIFGGEALDAGRLAPWWRRHATDGPRLVNMYGITETTVHVTFRPVGPGDGWSGAGSAIGWPIPDLAVHVLGPGLEPMPLGVPGELYVGGAGLARGYLGRPDLTAERFLPDPYGNEAGARLYRTGDLARRRASGELEYLGRADRQVKVRGFRIEPGEIEAALARHPAVAEAAVVVRDDLPGGRGLAAFWTALGPAMPGELRAFLKERLPEPLVPAVLILLDRLPLTGNGKTDRQALAAGPLPAGPAADESAPPLTPAEELLAGLWCELLGLERVGRGDDFFDLGGHSLLATQLVSRVRETFGVEIPLRTVFAAPTLERLAAAIPARGAEIAAPPIIPVPREGALPLSFAQRRLWFLDRLVPGNPFYVMAFGLRLEGELEVPALRRALAEVVRRHESLRTVFRSEAGEPLQVVLARMEVGLPLVDLSGLAPVSAGAELRALGGAEARRPFDLRRGPLLRGLLVRLGPTDHALLLHLHHIVADGWSMGVLRRELSVLYEAFLDGRPSPLPELAVQYPDFAVWQRRWLAGEALEGQLAYWRPQLEGAPPVLDLPFDRPRPAVETFRGGLASFALRPGLVRRLRELGRGLGTTLSMTALAAYDLLLSRYTGRDDVVVGSAVANRNRRETEGLIGFFVNILVLRTRLGGDPAFAELAGRVREVSLDAYAHQDLPFEKLVEELQLPRNLAHHPLCQVMYGFQNFPRHEVRVRGLGFTSLPGEAADTGTAKADLTLFLAEEDGGLGGWIEYNGDLFEPATILRLGQHLTALLEAAAEDPGRPARALPLLSLSERHQLLEEWSAAGPVPAPVPPFAERMAHWARVTPDAPALVSESGTLSYADLHGRALGLACRLRNAGVGPEVRVGLRLGDPGAVVEAVLGVLVAGGAWVALDPAYPEARLESLQADSECALVITQEGWLPRLPLAGSGSEPLPGNLAYIVYTSGSTGRPKGVGVTRASLDWITDALIRAYGVGPGDRVLQMMAPSFDVFVSEVALALGSGAALHVAGRDERLPGPPLTALLRRWKITVLSLVPSMLAALDPAEVPSLSTLILGGEACPPDLAARWAPGRRLFTAYGPTETTVTCTVGKTGLGRPLEGARIHLLDERLDPVPVGVPGELFVGGAGLARGYLGGGRTDLTAERFLPDPFGPPGARLYRTGDLARHRPDGTLEFLGRLDDQVKVRGFRVEPGEVEARLMSHPGVESAVAVAHGNTLAAYVVPRRGERGDDRDEQLASWRLLYDEVYGAADPDADLVGWNSSFTGEPLPAEEMREWARVTAEEILELRPERVLEIGCGTGLILREVAPACSAYVGTDFSAGVLEALAPRVASLPQVRLERRLADDFAGLPRRGFDTVVLNSVAQYFPGADYLVEVLEKAVDATMDGGAVYIGDVRSLPLAEDFYLEVERHADPSLPPDELRARAAARRLEEPELLVDPALFQALAGALPRVRGVEVRPKRGQADNELTRYRYQVVLRVGEGTPAPPAPHGPWSRWTNDPLLGRLTRRLVPELHAWARETLPDFLLPSAIVVLDALPRTPSGKVDRRALPAPGLVRTIGGETAPRTGTEAAVVEIFRALLNREALGTDTDFFEAGGHSLLATQVVSQLRDAFGVEIPLRDLFETPTAAGLAGRIDAALAARRGPAAPPLRPVPRQGPPPLSFAQERLWFLDQLDAGRSSWNLSTALRFEGRLDLAALKAALDEVVRRHEALRTTFALSCGRPVQIVAPSLRLALPVADLSGLPEARRHAELARWIGEELQRPFDLATGPLIRALALRLGPDDHAVALTLHHIVSDAWSMGVLVREMSALYTARLMESGRPPLPMPAVQYPDFALWQRRWLQGEALEGMLGWWRQRLEGAPPLLALPLDQPRPPVHAFRGRRRRGELAPETVTALSALARASGATLFMTLFAAWKALLLRVTGEPDLLVGTPVANRNRAETEGLIGFFVNTLVMRTDLGDNPTFLGLLARVRETALGAYAHQDLPFDKLVAELAPERDPGYTPLFQVLFAFEEEPVAPPDLPGLRLTPLGAESRTVKLDLTLLSRRLEHGGAELVLGYNSDLFHAATAERLLGHLETLIASAVADPGRPVSALALLSAAQRHQLLLDWNDTAEEGEALPLHRIFERQAALHPERTALVAPGERLTYGELDRRANRLARRLRREGVGPGVRVGLRMDRSPALVAALLAVLKAGGAWVPFDPGLPAERLAFLAADSGAALVLDEGFDAMVEDDSPLAIDIPLDALAYIIYTSGSTGLPKGVAVPHRGLANLARAQVDLFGLGPGDRVLQFASPGFDAFVSELAIAWQAGAELHLAPRDSLLPGASLADLLRERGITNVTLPPSALAVMPAGDFPALRSLVVAGEACPPELAERWSRGRRFTNAYGPTEATVCATAGPYEPGTLGRPIANMSVLLLDRHGEPVPPGVEGEVCLAGPGLARGYLGRPDLTAERFVPHPWSGHPGARLYRTGDLARRIGDGRIAYLGRTDEQVKVRGFRVEPGEVRAALLALPGVLEAEVLASPERIVAWAVPAPGSGAAAADLRRLLAERLPDWLVPSRIVLLDALPKTASGKVDRRALVLPDEGAGRPSAGRLEPADEVERFLLEVWREVLGRQAIGLEENFFELGGTSLQAAILTNLLQERLGDYVYAVALFDAPTIAELALYLGRNYPAATARLRGGAPAREPEGGGGIDGAMVAELRRLAGARPRRSPPAARNPRAVFILSPPRSGSTLLRVLLAGNRHLFAPPELELLGFDTLGERAAELSGRFSLWKEGAVRAVMEAGGLDLAAAGAQLAEMEERDLPVGELYRRLQEWTAPRTLVDKTPSYALDRGVLGRAEETFEEPLYLHLLRHPYGMIASFEEAKLEQVFFRPRHGFTRRQLAELIWRVSHENILEHLAGVPAARQLRLRYEDLVRDPQAEMGRVCAFLGVPFEEEMLAPYDGGRRRMTDGVHALSRMLGDVKFHTHAGVSPAPAERWKTVYGEDFLAEESAALARGLGYTERERPRFSPLVRLRAGGPEPPLFLVHPMGGGVLCYRELTSLLGDGQPVYGLQARGLGVDGELDETVEAMATAYLEEVRRVRPAGPYRLGGWSMGGVVAFEMARRLEELGETVDLLALLDAVAPGALPPVEVNDATVLGAFAREMGNQAGQDLGIREEDLRGLKGEERARFVLRRAMEMGALPAGFGLDQASRLWRVIGANMSVGRLHRPGIYSGSAILFVAENSLRPGIDPDLGWRRFIRGRIERVEVDADHSTLLRGLALQDVASALRRRLADGSGRALARALMA